jgi:Intracellular septation protein A
MRKNINHERVLRFFETSSSIVFLLTWWRYNIIVGTAAIMLWLTCMALYSLISAHPLSRLQKFIWLTSLLLGGITVVLNNPFFIKIRSTIVNSGVFLAFSLSHFIGKKTIVERLLGDHISAPKNMLRRVNGSFALFVLFIALCNYYTAYYLTENQWMWFSYAGKPIIYLSYISATLYYLREYLKDIESLIEGRQKPK